MTDSERAHLSAQTTRFFTGHFDKGEYGPLRMYHWALIIMTDYDTFLRKGDEQTHTRTAL